MMRVRLVTARRVTALLVTALLVTALAGCTGGTDQPSETKKLPAAEQLAAAKVKADRATSLHLTLRSDGIPDSVNGVLGADGTGTHTPAFKGTLEARISGFQAKVEVVAIGPVVYAKLPLTTQFTQIDPQEYSAPNPAQLFATEGGITSLITATTNPVEGATTRDGGEVLTTIKGSLPGAKVQSLLRIGDAAKTYDVACGITDPGGELRTVTVSGPFHKGSTPATTTYVLTLDKYGAPVEISKP